MATALVRELRLLVGQIYREGGAMWARWIVRVLAAVYIVGGVATLIAPESMARFTRWFANHPLLMRLDAVLIIALGTGLALREYREALHSLASGPSLPVRS